MVEVQNQQEELSNKFEGLANVNDVNVDDLMDDWDKQFEDIEDRRKELSVQEAVLLVNWANSKAEQNLLNLHITSLDYKVATELAKYNGQLSFTWLTSLDYKVAIELAKYNWNLLSLNWLISLDSEVTTELAKSKSDNLELDWLVDVDEQLINFSGFGLSLNWLTSLTPKIAEQLSKSKCHRLSLKWVTSLTPEIAEYLVNFEWVLSTLDNLDSKSKEYMNNAIK